MAQQGPNTPKGIRSFVAGGTISSYRLVQADAAEQEAKQAADVAKPIIGVALPGTDPDASAAISENDVFDVATGGTAHVEYGGAVNKEDALTTDSVGRAVATTTAGQNIIGYAEVDGEAGDVGSVRIAPSRY